MRYNKLVRDNIPNIIKAQGKTPRFHIATNDEEFWKKLKDKLSEEVKEFNSSEHLEELGDILEVIDEIISYKKFDPDKLTIIKNTKAEERGKFKKRIILEEF